VGGNGQEQVARGVDDSATLDEAIATLEAQRAVLGDAVVDTALRSLHQRRAALTDSIGGEQRKLVTVLFADLVDFTVLSRRLDAEDVRSPTPTSNGGTSTSRPTVAWSRSSSATR
jgi:class 3 adenylate cyclase